jgi:hypothetical protein
MKHIYKKLDAIIDNFNKIAYRNILYTVKPYDVESILSEENLNKISAEGDLEKPYSVERKDNYNSIVLDQKELFKIKLKEMVEKSTGIKRRYSGFFWYPPNGFCGWHTNNNAQGERIYFTWAAEDNKSFFRYKDPDTGEVITDWDKKGWQHRKFLVSKDKPFWHCVGSQTNRVSIGLKLDYN